MKTFKQIFNFYKTAIQLRWNSNRITLQPSGRRVFVLPGTKIIEAAGRAGININTPCHTFRLKSATIFCLVKELYAPHTYEERKVKTLFSVIQSSLSQNATLLGIGFKRSLNYPA